jgi:hypothetical protein
LALDPVGHLRVVKAAARLQRHPRIDEARCSRHPAPGSRRSSAARPYRSGPRR